MNEAMQPPADWRPLAEGEITSSRHMALEGIAQSEAAKGLTASVAVDLYLAIGGGKRGKPGKPLTRAVAALICDILQNAESDVLRWGFRSHRAGSFTDLRVGHASYSTVHGAMLDSGLLEVHRGYQRNINWGSTRSYYRGVETRTRGTGSFFQQLAEGGITPSNWKEHFIIIPPAYQGIIDQPLQCFQGSRRVDGAKIRGPLMPIDPEDALAKELEAQVNRLNQFMANHVVGGLSHRGFTRIFSQGDSVGFRWNKGGRLYSLGARSYMLESEENRAGMTLDGEPVVEIDIVACHLTILHALRAFALPNGNDVYSVEGLPREVVKAWVTMTLGHDRFHTNWPPEVTRRLEGNRGIRLKDDFPLKHIKQRIIDAIPLLRDWPESEFRWGDLHYRESCIVIGAMETLAFDHGIPSLPVHDSLIVPAPKRVVAQDALETSFRKVVGVVPRLSS
jgi:hypothetical protein